VRLCGNLSCSAALSPIAHGRRIYCSTACHDKVRAATKANAQPPIKRHCDCCGIELAREAHGLRLFCSKRCWRIVNRARDQRPNHDRKAA
jgi:hypothetical protein